MNRIQKQETGLKALVSSSSDRHKTREDEERNYNFTPSPPRRSDSVERPLVKGNLELEKEAEEKNQLDKPDDSVEKKAEDKPDDYVENKAKEKNLENPDDSLEKEEEKNEDSNEDVPLANLMTKLFPKRHLKRKVIKDPTLAHGRPKRNTTKPSSHKEQSLRSKISEGIVFGDKIPKKSKN